MSVLGGTRHWAGPAVGAVAITGLLYSFTAADHAVAGKALTGAILIAAILFMPEGILPRLQRPFARNAAGGAPPQASGHAAAPAGASRRAPAAAPAVALATERAREVDVRGGSVSAGAVLLSVRGLHKRFKGIHALSDVAFDVRRG